MDSPLAHMTWEVPYAMPDGYLASLAAVLARGVHDAAADDAETAQLPKALPFTTPDGYFATLAGDLRNAVLVEAGQEEKLKTPFAAPSGYFDELPAALTTVAQQAEHTPAANGRSMSLLQLWRVRYVRMAAAAILVLGIGVGSYRYLRPERADRQLAGQLSRIDAETINTYIEQHVDEFDLETLEAALASTQPNLPASISTLNESEIEDYLIETGEAAPITPEETL